MLQFAGAAVLAHAGVAGRAVAETAAKQAEYDWHRDPQTPIFYPQGAIVPTSR